MNQPVDGWRERLISAALAAQQRAYAPYSHFQVGAAILGADGRMYAGANVENASYGLTLCAERVAASSAVTAPERETDSSRAQKNSAKPAAEAHPTISVKHNWRAIAVASRGGVTPCGACRQFLMEFAPDMEVLLVDSVTNDVTSIAAMRQLLPAAFEFNTQFRQG